MGVGYILELKGKRIYHAGDTDWIPELKSLTSIDLAFIPIDGKFTMDYREAFGLALHLHPEVVITIHHLKTDPSLFANLVAEKSNIYCMVPALGKTIKLTLCGIRSPE